MARITFTATDYALFAVILIINLIIGFYFGIWKRKDQTKDVYLLGGKNMNVLPVATALIASNFSGVGLLAIPADVYMYGANIFWSAVTFPIMCFLCTYIYLPVFLELKPSTIYEYFKLRFNQGVRTFASFLYITSNLLYSPIVLFIPALGFSQVADINIHITTPIICIICICYTAVGGLKAVVWTTAINFIAMLASVILIIILGVISVGGIEDAWLRAVAGDRLSIFDFRFDVTVRDTFWSVAIGSIFHYMCLALLNQSAMQKFMAVSTNAHASRAISIFCIGFIVLTLLVICVGVIAYAKYWDCDPLKTNQVERLDQLIPLLAMEVAGKIPGVPGIFIAGVFCASLSSLSSSLNTISCSIYEDFIAVFIHKTFSETTVNVILKVIVLITGLICIALIFGLETMAGVFDFTIAVQAITNGPLLGLFTVGVLCPWVNGKGALVGGLSGLAFISWIVIGNQLYKSQGFIDYAKQLSTDGCIFGFNGTERIDEFGEPPFVLYRISIWYNSLIAAIFVVISASLISWLTKAKDHAVDISLISPIIRGLIRD